MIRFACACVVICGLAASASALAPWPADYKLGGDCVCCCPLCDGDCADACPRELCCDEGANCKARCDSAAGMACRDRCAGSDDCMTACVAACKTACPQAQGGGCGR